MQKLTDMPKDTKQTRVVRKTVPTESFFNFFDPPKPPVEEDEDVAEDVEERLELDYQLGEDIKEKLIPRAIDWFTGKALQFEEVDEELEEGDFEDEDDEEDDDVSEDRDDEDESDEEVRTLSPFSFSCFVDKALTWSLVVRTMARNLSKRPPNANRVELYESLILSRHRSSS